MVEADACSRIPLPGSEPKESSASVGDAQIVDVVVCSLSLMSTNWPVCVKEAWRILRAECVPYAPNLVRVTDWKHHIVESFKLQRLPAGSLTSRDSRASLHR